MCGVGEECPSSRKPGARKVILEDVQQGSGPDGSKVFQGATHSIIQHSPTIYFTGEDDSLLPDSSTRGGRVLKLSVLLAGESLPFPLANHVNMFERTDNDQEVRQQEEETES